KLNELKDLRKAPEVLSFPNIFDMPRPRGNDTSPQPPKNEPNTDIAAPEIPITPEEEEEETIIAEVDPKIPEKTPKVEISGYEITDSKPEDKKASITEKKSSRNNQIFSHLRLKTNKVTLLIMDYGTIDNDTVTIFYNDKIIANSIRLTNKAAEFELELEDHLRNELVFVANNLGDVPPNTAR